MARKKIVSAEWHAKAMEAIEIQEESVAFIQGLRVFLATKLSPEQQSDLESEIAEWIDNKV